MRASALLFGPLIVCACGTQAQRIEYLRRESSGMVGCPRSEIQISDIDQNTWTVTCRGSVYYCAKDFDTLLETTFRVGPQTSPEATTCTPAGQPAPAVASAQPAHPPQPAPPPPPEEGIASHFDEFEQKTTLQLQLQHGAVRLLLTGQPGTDPGRMSLALGRVSAAATYVNCRNVDMLVDGAPSTLPPDNVHYRGAPAHGGGVYEVLTAWVPHEEVQRLASARDLKLRACRDALVFDARQLGFLRAYLDRWDAELAKAPEPDEPLTTASDAGLPD